MNKVTYIRDTQWSFIKTTTNENGEQFSRKIQKGTTDYSNACNAFHNAGVSIETGNSVNA
jgi:hypothetical protein